MPKPAKLVVGIVGTLALTTILGVCAFRERRPSPAPTKPDEPPALASPTAPGAAATKSAPPSTAPVLAAPKPWKATEPDARKPLDEATLLARVREIGPSNLELSLQLAREAVARFPESPNAPEFEMNIAKSLLHLGRVEEAREQARLMLKKYPGNSFTLEVEHHLLRNPPNPR